jgi:protein O-mannosyl-transferase
LRRTLDVEFDSASASLLAWILATSRDDRLRDGRAALAFAERVARAQPDDPSALSSVAAACAELGRFREAVVAAERALSLARAGGDREAEALLQQRLESYRGGRPWRQ